MDYNSLNLEIEKYLNIIKKEECYIELSKVILEIKEKYNEEIKLFKELKEKLKEVNEYGSYHPDYNRVRKEYQELKIKLYSQKEIKLYFKYLNQLDERINDDLISVKREFNIDDKKGCHK